MRHGFEISEKDYDITPINGESTKIKVDLTVFNGDCGYAAMGITRNAAYDILVDAIIKEHSEVLEIITTAINATLITEECRFINFLIREKIIDNGDAGRIVSELKNNFSLASLSKLVGRDKAIDIVSGYVMYDVKFKGIFHGWPHPAILQALASVLSINLEIYDGGALERDKELRLSAAAANSAYKPTLDGDLLRLVYFNNKHFAPIMDKFYKKKLTTPLDDDASLLNRQAYDKGWNEPQVNDVFRIKQIKKPKIAKQVAKLLTRQDFKYLRAEFNKNFDKLYKELGLNKTYGPKVRAIDNSIKQISNYLRQLKIIENSYFGQDIPQIYQYSILTPFNVKVRARLDQKPTNKPKTQQELEKEFKTLKESFNNLSVTVDLDKAKLPLQSNASELFHKPVRVCNTSKKKIKQREEINKPANEGGDTFNGTFGKK